LHRLPFTAVLIVLSTIMAMAAAYGCIWLTSRKSTAWAGSALAAVLFAFACVPVFWWAVELQLPLYGALRGASLSDECLFSAAVLALIQSGAYVDCLRQDRSARALLATFAMLLPALLSADPILEILYAWPGAGRAVITGLGDGHHGSYYVAYVLFSAGVVICLRAITNARGGITAVVDLVEPL
jgi:ABC-type dipeptide/oligopeptide/nickel transport system permease component